MKNKFYIILVGIVFLLSACTYNNSSSTVSTIETVEEISDVTESTNEYEENIDKNIAVNNPFDDELIWTGDNLKANIYLEDIEMDLLPDKIVDNCIKKLNVNFSRCDKLSGVKVVMWDMNDDGVEDYFVVPFPAGYAGNSLPPLYLFVAENDNFKIIDIPIKTDNSIKVLSSKTNGYYDLQWDSFGNVLYFDGVDKYIGRQESNISVSMFSVTQENEITCIKADIPYEISDYSQYYLKMCLFDKNFNKILIATSNDKQYNNVIYSNSNLPINGEYCFYIKTSTAYNIDFDDVIVEFKCVNA